MPTPGPISGACSCHSGCSVAGFSSKRFFPPLTVARSHSAPSLHGHYPLPRYYGLSDARRQQTAGLPGSSADRSPRAASNHPGESDGCLSPVTSPSIAGFVLIRQIGHSQRVTRLNRVRFRCGSWVRLARLRDADCSNSTRLLGYIDERAISRVSSFQLTRSARLGLAHRITRITRIESYESVKSAAIVPSAPSSR